MPRFRTPPRHRAGAARLPDRRRWLQAAGAWLLAATLAAPAPDARADGIELPTLELARSDDGLLLSFSTRFELPRLVEDALAKGVPLYFVADATLYRSRWYWRDVRVAQASRTWRLAWQPLTRSYRVSFGGLNQSYESLGEAMAGLRGAARWKIAEASQLEPDARHYVEFSYRLDTTQLPRPMQIGLPNQAEWTLSVERTVALD